jgi:hypothetical protein
MRAELTLGRSAGRRLTPSIHNVMWKYVDVELSKCRIGTRSTQRTKQKNVVINAIEGISAACKQDLATDCTTRSAFDTSPLALVYPIAVGVTRHRGTALLTCASRVGALPSLHPTLRPLAQASLERSPCSAFSSLMSNASWGRPARSFKTSKSLRPTNVATIPAATSMRATRAPRQAHRRRDIGHRRCSGPG